MVCDLFFYQLMLIALLWLCVMLQWAWPSDPVAACSTIPEPPPSLPKRRCEPKPFAGLTTKPYCDACESARAPRPQTPSAPPPRIVMTRGRRREVDTSRHFCPNPDCTYRGWVGWGNLRANGHPHGGPWRQLLCVACRRYFLETLGTLLHGKRTSVELIVRSVPCLLQFLLAPRERTPAPTTAGTHQGHGLREAVAALYASHGGRIDRARVVAQRGAPLSRATVATAPDGLRNGAA